MIQMRRFNLGPVGEADCPVFDDMFSYFRVRDCAVAVCSNTPSLITDIHGWVC